MLAPLMGDNPLTRGGLVLIEAHVITTMDLYRQDAPGKFEAGGILLGHRRGIHLQVTGATEPAASDRRTRTRFHRSPAVHQDIATQRWRLSRGTIDYLGEWHTHPEYEPQPSGIDCEAWRAIYHSRQPLPMIFIIMGSSSHHWFGLGQNATLRELQLT